MAVSIDSTFASIIFDGEQTFGILNRNFLKLKKKCRRQRTKIIVIKYLFEISIQIHDIEVIELFHQHKDSNDTVSLPMVSLVWGKPLHVISKIILLLMRLSNTEWGCSFNAECFKIKQIVFRGREVKIFDVNSYFLTVHDEDSSTQ